MEKVFMLLFLIASEIYGTTSLPRAKISNGKEDKITPYFPPITINLVRIYLNNATTLTNYYKIKIKL